MKISFILFVALFCGSLGLYSQSVYDIPSDTIKFEHRTGGIIDTFDLSFTFPINSAPIGGFESPFNSPNISFIGNSPNLFTASKSPLLKNWRVSALPHLGFKYSVGTKAIQFLHMDYQQVFRNGLLMNLEIHRISNVKAGSTAGLTQNNSFTNQDASVGFNYQKKKWDVKFLGGYRYVDANLSGGIVDSLASEIDALGLEFITVNKPNANSNQRFIDLNARLRYSFKDDSTQTKFGIQTLHEYALWNRVYNERADSLNLIYPAINIDFDTTRDQFQDAKIKNGLGLFFEMKNLKIDALFTHRYWRFQNLGTNRDTNEIGAEANIKYQIGKISFQNHTEFNFIGAEQEFRTQNAIMFGAKSKGFGIQINQQNILPELVQRNYFANNLNYSNPLVKQNISEFSIKGNYSIHSIDGEMKLGIVNWRDKLVWDQGNWVINSFSDQTIQQIDFKLHWDLGVLQLYPRALIQLGSEFVPTRSFLTRIVLKKKVFKAKKLELLWALDPSVRSQYSLLAYSTLLDNYYFPSNTKVGGQTFTLHSAFSLGIDEFRFFLRAENIQHFWTSTAEEVRNYYRAPFLFRVGFSWDFFN